MHPIICRILTGFIPSKTKRRLFRSRYLLNSNESCCFKKFHFREGCLKKILDWSDYGAMLITVVY